MWRSPPPLSHPSIRRSYHSLWSPQTGEDEELAAQVANESIVGSRTVFAFARGLAPLSPTQGRGARSLMVRGCSNYTLFNNIIY